MNRSIATGAGTSDSGSGPGSQSHNWQLRILNEMQLQNHWWRMV